MSETSQGIIETPDGLQIKYPNGLPLIDTDKIIRNPKNIKHHPKVQFHDLAELIKMVGFKDPIVLDEKKMLFAGHGRLDAAELLKMPKVPWWPLQDMTEEEKKVFLLMDNKVNESEWISQNVEQTFEDVGEQAFEKFDMEFEHPREYEDFSMKTTEEVDIPEGVPKRVERGDLWALGDHTLLCGDCTLPDHKAKLLGDQEIDIICTDPP